MSANAHVLKATLLRLTHRRLEQARLIIRNGDRSRWQHRAGELRGVHPGFRTDLKQPLTRSRRQDNAQALDEHHGRPSVG